MFGHIFRLARYKIFSPKTLRQFSTAKDEPICIPKTYSEASKLPISPNITIFKENKWIYVDKTMQIYSILHLSGSIVIIRPRRFGKSLFLSVAEAIATKNDILREYEVWKHLNGSSTGNPVIRLDFSRIGTEPGSVKRYLKNVILKHWRILNQVHEFESVNESFGLLLEDYCRKGKKPFIFIDEYDVPFWNFSSCEEELESLRSFFKLLKACNEYTQQVIIIGCTSIRKADLFSGANHFVDFSLSPETATVFGFTEAEIRRFFHKHIDELAIDKDLSVEETMARLKYEYNGYKFYKDSELVYNPISIIETLRTKEILNHWGKTSDGHNKLKTLLSQSKEMKSNTPSIVIPSNDMVPLDITNPLVPLFLWQAGYLTIDSYDKKKEEYTLKYPNQEAFMQVQGMKNLLIKEGIKTELYQSIEQLGGYLVKCEISKFGIELAEIIKREYVYDKKRHEYSLEDLLVTYLRLCGFRCGMQVTRGNGIADIVATKDRREYVIELKVDQSARIALNQIMEKQYFMGNLSTDENEKICIGINYSNSPCKAIDSIAYKIISPGVISKSIKYSIKLEDSKFKAEMISDNKNTNS